MRGGGGPSSAISISTNLTGFVGTPSREGRFGTDGLAGEAAGEAAGAEGVGEPPVDAPGDTSCLAGGAGDRPETAEPVECTEAFGVIATAAGPAPVEETLGRLPTSVALEPCLRKWGLEPSAREAVSDAPRPLWIGGGAKWLASGAALGMYFCSPSSVVS